MLPPPEKRKIFVTIQLFFASGGPAGGQTFEKFDKQILIIVQQFVTIQPSFDFEKAPLFGGGHSWF